MASDPPSTSATVSTASTPRPVGCTNLKLRQLSRLVARHYEGFVAPTGLKNTQYSLLSYVVKLGPLPAGELAAAIRLSPSALSRNLQPLLDHGWAEIVTGADARQRIVRATAAGVALRVEAQRAWKRAQLAMNERLGPARAAALHGLLDECMALLDDGSAGGDEGVPG